MNRWRPGSSRVKRWQRNNRNMFFRFFWLFGPKRNRKKKMIQYRVRYQKCCLERLPAELVGFIYSRSHAPNTTSLGPPTGASGCSFASSTALRVAETIMAGPFCKKKSVELMSLKCVGLPAEWPRKAKKKHQKKGFHLLRHGTKAG